MSKRSVCPKYVRGRHAQTLGQSIIARSCNTGQVQRVTAQDSANWLGIYGAADRRRRSLCPARSRTEVRNRRYSCACAAHLPRPTRTDNLWSSPSEDNFFYRATVPFSAVKELGKLAKAATLRAASGMVQPCCVAAQAGPGDEGKALQHLLLSVCKALLISPIQLAFS